MCHKILIDQRLALLRRLNKDTKQIGYLLKKKNINNSNKLLTENGLLVNRRLVLFVSPNNYTRL